jgi:phosphatidate cytidylyltransferase
MSESQSKINTGRNLPVATAVGLSLLFLLIGLLYWNLYAFTAVIALAAILATREILRLNNPGIPTSAVMMIASPLIVIVAFDRGIGAATTTAAAFALFAMIVRLFDGVEGYIHATGSILLAAFYGPVLLGFTVDLAHQPQGVGKVLTVILLTSASDTGGYFAGIFFGRHPMAPAISPRKSWEGFAGSLVLAAIVGAFLITKLVDISVEQGFILGIGMAATATAGDLIESALKRDAGVKDSGTMFPGHGGILDRIDSQLVNSLIAWFAFTIVFGV